MQISIPNPFMEMGSIIPLPEDVESADKETIKGMIKSYFDAVYPDFEPETLITPEKEYYLPALKVLDLKDGRYYSPSKKFEWKDNELVATCMAGPLSFYNSAAYKESDFLERGHEAPHEDCDCGIYGSVNLEEIVEYLEEPKTFYNGPLYSYSPTTGNYEDYAYTQPPPIKKTLCIIEPYPEAKTIICRKGWKTSRAFISEIVGETISIEDASQLLSMSWKRNIDVRKLYENR